jgi:hypothetical protein
MTEPSQIGVQGVKGEYIIHLAKYGFAYHADVKIGDADPLLQQAHTVPFLIGKLVADLEHPEKIKVFRQNEEPSANDLIDLGWRGGHSVWYGSARKGL